MVRLRIAELLAEREMSAYRLAKRAGLSLSTIYRLTGRKGHFHRIEARTLDYLCAALQCLPGDLLVRCASAEVKPTLDSPIAPDCFGQ